jgi:hypothetical protein
MYADVGTKENGELLRGNCIEGENQGERRGPWLLPVVGELLLRHGHRGLVLGLLGTHQDEGKHEQRDDAPQNGRVAQVLEGQMQGSCKEKRVRLSMEGWCEKAALALRGYFEARNSG